MRRKSKPGELIVFTLSLAIFFILFGFKLCFAQKLEDVLDMEVKISTGNYVKEGCSLPVTVDIKNKGEGFRGRLSILVHKYTMQKKSYNEYYKEVDVPGHSYKRYFLFIPHVQYYPGEIKVRIARGQDFIEEKIRLRWLRGNDEITMVLNPQQGGLSYLASCKGLFSGNTSHTVVHPDPAKIPINWKCFDSNFMIIINDLPALQLSNDQEKALLNYVKSGGAVLFSSNLDPNEFNNSVFRDYLPMKPQKTETITQQMMEDKNILRKDEIVVVTGPVRGKSFFRIGRFPFVTRRKLGKGVIYFLAADISRKILNEKYEMTKFWKLIYDDARTIKTRYPQVDMMKIMNAMPEFSPPSVGNLILILLIYAILIGPVAYFYLKKKDRLLWIFVIIPVTALIFTGVIFFVGVAEKGSNLILRNFSVVTTSPGNSSAFIDSGFSIFSPAHLKYDLFMGDPVAVGWDLTGYYQRNTVKVNLSDEMVIEDEQAHMWNLRSYRVQKPIDLQGEIQMEVRFEGDRVVGTIDNNTGLNLSDCVLIRDGRISGNFQLPPGRKNINLLSSKIPTSKRAMTVVLINRFDLDTDKKKKDHLLPTKKAFVENISDKIIQDMDNFILMGWNNSRLSNVHIDRNRSKKLNASIFYVR